MRIAVRQLDYFDQDVESRHYDRLERRVRCGINRFLKGVDQSNQFERDYAKLLQGYSVKELLVGRVPTLRKIVTAFDAILPPGKFWDKGDPRYNQGAAELTHSVRRAFNYEGFRDEDYRTGNWCGGALAKAYAERIRYCPYCNAETLYAFEWCTDDGRLKLSKSAFDHFFTRARYPFLALSLYNLIPSCTRCNSAFKVDDFGYIVKTAHPFQESIDDGMRFHVLFSSLGAVTSVKAEDLAGIVLTEKRQGGFPEGARLEHMVRVSDSYSALYTTDAAIYLQRAICFPESYVRGIKQRLQAKGFPTGDVEKMLFGAPLERTEIDCIRHGKLICDIRDQYRS